MEITQGTVQALAPAASAQPNSSLLQKLTTALLTLVCLCTSVIFEYPLSCTTKCMYVFLTV